MAKMDAWLKLQLPKVVSNVTVVTPATLGTDMLLHVSRDPKIKKFTPIVSHRTAANEDRTVARICGAPTVVGCLQAYQEQYNDFHRNVGWTIYGIPFDEALQPNGHLVYDATRTGEHWLVAYDRDHVTYPSKTVGHMFFSSVKYTAGKQYRMDIEIYLEVLQPFSFAGKTPLKKGYYTLVLTGVCDMAAYTKLEPSVVSAIDKAIYERARKVSDVTHSNESMLPSLEW